MSEMRENSGVHLTVEYIDADKLKVYGNNAKIHIDIRKYGFDLEDKENEYIIENKEYSPAEFDDEKFEYECQGCGFRFNA